MGTRIHAHDRDGNSAGAPRRRNAVHRIRKEANHRDVPYPSLIKTYLSEHVAKNAA